MSFSYYTNKSTSDMSQAKPKLYDSQKGNNLYFATPPLKDLAEKVCSFDRSSLIRVRL